MRQRVTFGLECDTAMFLHGADARKRAELRAAAFKGAARYWFRAALGPCVDADTLRAKESLVFGSTDGRGVRFSVRHAEESTNALLLPHKDNTR